MFWVLNLLVSGRFLSAYGSGGLVSQPSKEAEGGAGRRWISGAVCCIDQCIKIPPSTVFQDLACHLVTDFAIRSLCLSCTLRNPTDLGRALLLLSPSEELPGWLAQSVLFRIDPSNTSVSKLWKSGTHLCQMAAFIVFSSSICQAAPHAFLWMPLACYYAMGYPFPVAVWYLFLVTHPSVRALASCEAQILLQKLSSLWVVGGLTSGAAT